MVRRVLSLCILVAGTTLGSVGATQYLAQSFGYAPELGEPVFTTGSVRLYPPFAWQGWARRWAKHAHRPFGTAMLIAVGGLLGSLAVAARVRGVKQIPKPTGAFGTARWATLRELKRARVLADRGIVLGQLDDAIFAERPGGSWVMQKPSRRLLRYDGDGHTACFFTTRGGKGITLVVPTLLSYTDGSVLIHDPKGENWNLTAGWRRKFSHCLRFEPTAEHSVRFNPLLEVRAAPFDVRDAQNIAEMIVNPASMTDEQRDHWKLTGHAFLVGVILHVLYAEKDKSLAGVLHVLTDAKRSFDDFLDAMLNTRHLPSGPHPTVAGAARAMLDRDIPERSSVKSTATSFLEIYRDPLLAANTAKSDFTIADLMCAEAPVSLYFVVPDGHQDRLRPVVRLMLNVIGRRLTENLTHVDCGPSLHEQRTSARDRANEPSPWTLRGWRFAFWKMAGTALKTIQLARVLSPYLAASQPIEVTLNPSGRSQVDRSDLDAGRLLPKRHKLLCLIDEFPMLGRIPFFANGISSMAGYGIRCLLIMQSLKQLENEYGRANSILDNCVNRVTAATNCDQTAERISRLLGTQSLVRPQISISKRPGLFGGEQVSESYQEYGRPLRTVDELLTMPFPDLIVMPGNCRPYLGKKFFYYQDPVFSSRAGNLRGDGPNAPPTSPREQRAELPPRRRRCHWLELPTPARGAGERPTAPQKRTPSKTVESASPSADSAKAADIDELDPADSGEELAPQFYADFFPPNVPLTEQQAEGAPRHEDT